MLTYTSSRATIYHEMGKSYASSALGSNTFINIDKIIMYTNKKKDIFAAIKFHQEYHHGKGNSNHDHLLPLQCLQILFHLGSFKGSSCTVVYKIS